MTAPFQRTSPLTGSVPREIERAVTGPVQLSVPSENGGSPRPHRRTGEETRRAVVAAARAQIEAAGLITLNVAAVARACDVNETLIYRHFRSRSGLLEATLGEMWDDHAAESRASIETLLRRVDELPATEVDPAGLIDALPVPGSADDAHTRLLLIQIIAASATLPGLRRRMAETQRSQDAAIEQALRVALRELPEPPRAQIARALRALLTGVTLGFAISDLDPQHAPDDDDVRTLWSNVIDLIIESREPVGTGR